MLITDLKDKTNVWAKNFKNLALYATGNSQNNIKWIDNFKSNIRAYSICKSTINWAKIITALNNTLNKKAAKTNAVIPASNVTSNINKHTQRYPCPFTPTSNITTDHTNIPNATPAHLLQPVI
ncbi:hypothetical protein BB561_002347 [Smittium simulii]|uniref:Uncharacterized protein n=1 Tax=Smittium simulii TaxID=133385 RepID=A0A2T9YQR0_9FUNG|nr:hypothetical protein BB561_002347 [Smittium simulii]